MLTGGGVVGGQRRWSPLLQRVDVRLVVVMRMWVDVTDILRGRIFTFAPPYGGKHTW